MKARLPLRRRRPDPDPGYDSSANEIPPIAAAGEVVKTTITGRALSAVVFAALIAGPLGLGLGVLRGVSASHPASASSTAAGASADPEAVGRVGEFATQLVVATLTGTQGGESPEWLPGPGAGSEPLRVANPDVVSVIEESTLSSPAGRVWSATVTVSVTPADAVASRWWFTVPVLVDVVGTLRALAGPSQVAAPAFADPAPTAYPDRVTAGPVMDAVIGFLQAYLTGVGEVSRYTSPGTPMSAIVPTPYRSVTVIKVATGPSPASDPPDPVDGDQLHALVAVTAIASDSQKISLTYALLLTLRARRREVLVRFVMAVLGVCRIELNDRQSP